MRSYATAETMMDHAPTIPAATADATTLTMGFRKNEAGIAIADVMDASQESRDDDRPEERPPMAFREPPAAGESANGIRVLKHDRGGVQAHRDAEVESDHTSDGQEDEGAADRRNRGRRINRPARKGQREEQEQGDQDYRENQDAEQEVRPKDAQELLEALSEGGLQCDGLSAEAPDRIIRHPSGDDAVDDHAADGCKGDEKDQGDEVGRRETG